MDNNITYNIIMYTIKRYLMDGHYRYKVILCNMLPLEGCTVRAKVRVTGYNYRSREHIHRMISNLYPKATYWQELKPNHYYNIKMHKFLLEAYNAGRMTG